jgi:NADH:ubiquinone oxidoreductase subunit 5 (subunit L)/multisubunit Na+/H+ antiporter MnhA subunit
MDQLIPLIVGLPILGFAFSALFGRRIQATYGKAAASFVPVMLIVATWLISMGVAYTALTGGFGEHGASVTLWHWITAGTFQVDIGFVVDNLTAVLLIVVTTIGMLVHIYSIGYMSHDGGYWRFFAYLNLFMFSMLILILANNFLLVFAGWELVGLSSYLLIGFWYRKRTAALAAKKAFIVNRVGDVGFALGIMAIFVSIGTRPQNRIAFRMRYHRLQSRQLDFMQPVIHGRRNGKLVELHQQKILLVDAKPRRIRPQCFDIFRTHMEITAGSQHQPISKMSL